MERNIIAEAFFAPVVVKTESLKVLSPAFTTTETATIAGLGVEAETRRSYVGKRRAAE